MNVKHNEFDIEISSNPFIPGTYGFLVRREGQEVTSGLSSGGGEEGAKLEAIRVIEQIWGAR